MQKIRPHFSFYEDIDPKVFRSFKPRKRLNPHFWSKSGKLKPAVRDDLLKIAYDFHESTGLPEDKLMDIQFSGSLANLNYSQFSDIDLDLIYDLSDLSEDARKATEAFIQAQSKLWAERHKISIFGHPVGLYARDQAQESISSGVYSIMEDGWIMRPTPGEYRIDAPEVKKKANALSSEIEDIILSQDREKMDEFWEKLRRMRTEGLRSGGEFSLLNLVFKALRRSGDLQKLSDFEDRLYDESRSLN
jgi:hypothetical protein